MQVARLEQEGVGSPDEEALLPQRKGETTDCFSHWNWIIKSGSGSLRTRRCQCKEWKQQRFIKGEPASFKREAAHENMKEEIFMEKQ